MNRILAQAELDDLIKAVSTDLPQSLAENASARDDADASASGASRASGSPAFGEPAQAEATSDESTAVRRFDLRKATLLSSAQRELLAGVCERIAQGSTKALGLLLQRLAAVRVHEIRPCLATDLLDSYPGSACSIVSNTTPDRGHVLILVEPALAFLLVDLFLGGRGDTFSPDRELSDIDLKVSEKAIRAIEKQVRDAAEELLRIKLKRASFESRPRQLLAQFVGQHLVRCGFEFLMGEFRSYFVVGLPIGAAQAETRSTRRTQHNAQDLGDRLTEPLRKVPLDVSVELEPFEVKLSDLLGLQVGDVVRTAAAVSGPLRVSVAGIPKLSGELIVENGKRVLRLL
jgi:flagellar motor switch protein FliM